MRLNYPEMLRQCHLLLLVVVLSSVPACGPVGPGELRDRFGELRPRLNRLAEALRESASSGSATRVAELGMWSRCEVSSRTEAALSKSKEKAALEHLCPLVSGLALNAFVDADNSVWLMTWSAGAPGDYGGYVLPGSEVAKRELMAKQRGRMLFEEIAGSGGWMVYEDL